MNYKFEEVIYSNGSIYTTSPKESLPTKKEVAIIAHIFYIDIYNDIVEYLEKLNIDFDFFVTIPPIIKGEDIKSLFIKYPKVRVFIAENRGRDVLPFLQTINYIGLNNYKHICKLHTKKTGNSPLGDVWRRLLYFDLIGSAKTVNDILELFKQDSTIGEITGKNTILDSKRYAYGNNSKIKYLCKELNIEFKDDYYFSGGTMFWSRVEALAPILKLFRAGKLEFEEERGQKDHTLAHAIERFFGIVVQDMGLKITPSPSDYSKLPKEVTEATANLVLGQQYAGQDVYEKINELNDYIHELEILAESMRIKNRIKRLPSDILKVAKYKIITAKLPQVDSNRVKSASKKVLAPLRTIKKNPAVLKKVFYYLKRGEFKYLISKVNDKLKKGIETRKDFVKIDLNNYFEPLKKRKYHLDGSKVDIIIPVYNGYDYLEPLFKSLLKNTTYPSRLIVVNDASSDSRVLSLLKAVLVEFEDSILIENKKNLGFVKSVNKAVTNASNHFVILNTDTEVPPFWLERLMYPIFKMEKIATTTPFTNSGTIASFPNFLEDNDIFENLSVEELDSAFMQIKPEPNYAKIPTGVGFCMGVNYNLVKEIGFFDEESFDKGYGEENDWCQRAIKNGYSNLLVPNLFVYHKHGGSFPSEVKQKLIEQNHLKLLNKHPNYDMQIQEYVKKDPHNTLRKLLIINASSLSNPIWIVFDHALGGGANLYADSLLNEKIKNNENTLIIRYDFYSNDYVCSYRYKDFNFNFLLKSFEDVSDLLSRLQIKELFINSLVSFPQQKEILEYVAKLAQQIKVEVPIHDYFCVCPSFTLLNKDGVYCNVPSINDCKECMLNNKQEWKNLFLEEIDIETWRELWSNILNRSSKIICFSNSSKDIIKRAYPNIKNEIIELSPHKVENINKIELQKKSKDEAKVIGILGAINYAKGASIVKDLVDIIDKENLNINVVVIGEITETINSKHFTSTGRYKKEELEGLVKKHKIDIFLIPSICPETFSYTTQEIIMMDMPLMVFNIGAPVERVKDYKKGIVLDKISAKEVIDNIKL